MKTLLIGLHISLNTTKKKTTKLSPFKILIGNEGETPNLGPQSKFRTVI